jgi:6,7-dimethyl-8-ribityllumazine synthase
MNQHSQNPAAKTTQGVASLRVAVVSSGWHQAIVGNARKAILEEFARNGISASSLESFEVPGAFEIPLHAKRLAQSGEYDAIIACGLVVDGGIYRHEFVASAVIDGLMQVQLTTDIPVFSAVLTPHHFHEHGEHLDYFAKHFLVKGAEVARACLATVASLRQLPAKRA